MKTQTHALPLLAALLVVVVVAGAVTAQEAPPPAREKDAPAAGDPSAAPSETPSPAQADEDDDMVLRPAEPDFTVVNLPTTLRLPKHKLAFRVTHRFTRDLTIGGFDDLLADFFGFDGGAQIGLELRYGLMKGWQVGIYRTSDRTIEFFTQYNALRQAGSMPLTVDLFASAEGTNNFNDEDSTMPTGEGVRSPAIGAVVTRTFGAIAAVHAAPVWVNNTNTLPGELVDDNSTFMVGLGGRLRIRPTVYLVAEITPRLSGYAPGPPLGAFGIEKRVGGHAFQVNFSNGFGSTMGQIARGGVGGHEDADGDEDVHWFIGFNITRKFY